MTTYINELLQLLHARLALFFQAEYIPLSEKSPTPFALDSSPRNANGGSCQTPTCNALFIIVYSSLASSIHFKLH